MLHQWIHEHSNELSNYKGTDQTGPFTPFFQDFDSKLHTKVFTRYLAMVTIINKYESPESAVLTRSELPEYITSFDDYQNNEDVIVKRLNKRYQSKIDKVSEWVTRYLKKKNPASLPKVESIISDSLKKVGIEALPVLLPCALRRAYETEKYAKSATWSTEHPTSWDVKPALMEYLYFREIPQSKLDEFSVVLTRDKTALEVLFNQLESDDAKAAFVSRDKTWPLLLPFWRNSWYPKELIPRLKACAEITEMKILKNGSREVVPKEGETQFQLTELGSEFFSEEERDAVTEDVIPSSPTRSLCTQGSVPSPTHSMASEGLSFGSISRSWPSRRDTLSGRPPILVRESKKAAIKMPGNSDVPGSLTITSPKLKEVRGVFVLSPTRHNSLPFWKQPNGDKVIYCGSSDKWLVGKVNVMEKSKGWLISEVHDGRYPFEMPRWFARLNSAWTHDPEIVVEVTPPNAEGAAQQQPSRPASPPIEQRAAPHSSHRSLSPAAVNSPAAPQLGQLGVSVKQLLEPLIDSSCQRCLKFQQIVEMQQVESEKCWLQLQNEKDRVVALETSLRILKEQQQQQQLQQQEQQLQQQQRGGSPFNFSQAEDVVSVEENSTMTSLQQKYDEERIKVNSLSRQLQFLRERESTRDDVGTSLISELHHLNEKALEIAMRQINRTRDAISQISATLSTQQEGRLTTLLGSMMLNIEKDALQWSREICPNGIEKQIANLNQQLKQHREENGSPPLVPPPESEMDVLEMQRALNRLQKRELEAPLRAAELQVAMGEQQREIAERDRYISSLRLQLSENDKKVNNLQTQLDAAHAAMGLMSGKTRSSSPRHQTPPLILRGSL
eukprot:TRINITY_DN5064_c1_g2_i1.p1 TRINITY_DN5064_c1_g2~~TRINITY_DN5064_c1_g2_i1.p1  ORF type:complete len:922 (+),score=201.43 TRINITY_DN5064_c1_g2_i1:246-2768(+)